MQNSMLYENTFDTANSFSGNLRRSFLSDLSDCACFRSLYLVPFSLLIAERTDVGEIYSAK